MNRITYRPAWWLPGGHLMTLWRQFAHRHVSLPLTKHRVDLPDGDFVDLMRLSANPDAPRLVVLHGLEGSVRSRYIATLFEEVHQRGWGMDVMLFRSCSDEANRLARFYHSGETGDVAFVLDQILAEFPAAPVALAGFSLGGNVLLKWLGEIGSEAPSRICAAVAVSVPFDLAKSADRIGAGFSKIYEWHFLRSLKRKARAKAKRFPGHPAFGRIDVARSLRQFDDFVTAPLHGFSGASDYYEKSSSLSFLARIRVPTLLLSAIDDPFLPAPVLDEVASIASDNPDLTIEFQPRGGHVGFVGGAWPWKPEYYAEARLATFCEGRFADHLRDRTDVLHHDVSSL